LPDDGIIEAIRLYRRSDTGPGASYVAAVQWHPEFHNPKTACWTTPRYCNDFLAAAARANHAPD
jgi:putative glutamine amidotransferase